MNFKLLLLLLLTVPVHLLPACAFACVANSLKRGFPNKSSLYGRGQLFFFDLFRLGQIYFVFKTFCYLGKKTHIRLNKDVVFDQIFNTKYSPLAILKTSIGFDLILTYQMAKIYIGGIVQCKLSKERTEKLFIAFQSG